MSLLPSAPSLTRRPGYLPDGYRLARVAYDQGDGFRGRPTELIQSYVRAGDPSSAKPLQVLVSRSMRTMSSTEGHVAERIKVRSLTGSASVAEYAEYQDGLWSPLSSGSAYWDTSDAHSLVLGLNGMTIGIRGSREAGISRRELIRIAESMAY